MRLGEFVGNSAVQEKFLTFDELCSELSISCATGKNWLKLNKITPDKVLETNENLFLKSSVESLKISITNGKNSILKSRRNKNFVSGNSIYSSYICENSVNVSKIQSVLEISSCKNIKLTEEIIMLLVAECALQLYIQRSQTDFAVNVLQKYLSEAVGFEEMKSFIEPLISDRKFAFDFINNNRELFEISYNYEYGEDILGLLYLSLKNIGCRKAQGAYYTPTGIVNRLIENLFAADASFGSKKIFDPCCGTGNFLLQLPRCVNLDNIYANDIDKISVHITRINLALQFGDYDYKKLCAHVSCADYLKQHGNCAYDYIIGNPPWGYKFSIEEQIDLKKNFKTAQKKNIESFDVIIEKALGDLKKGGVLSFVVPESILNVNTHNVIREILIATTEFEYLEYLGNVFDKVQCPSIIIQLRATGKKMTGLGLRVKDKNREFTINKKRSLTQENLLFKADDEEHELVEKLLNSSNCTTLKNNAIFALGIVTGNNSKNIEPEKNSGNELILKGSDIEKYVIKSSNSYITFKGRKFQQVAPLEYYRAKEKLLYKFISNKLIFVYDNKQTLTLNSCNILIPQIEGLNIKYVLAVLNSKISQFIYSKQFNSIKVLRHHLETLPIPIVQPGVQSKIITIVDKIIIEKSEPSRRKLCEEIDEILFNIFNLEDKERKIITKNAVS